jgi:hypothetical protein
MRAVRDGCVGSGCVHLIEKETEKETETRPFKI